MENRGLSPVFVALTGAEGVRVEGTVRGEKSVLVRRQQGENDAVD